MYAASTATSFYKIYKYIKYACTIRYVLNLLVSYVKNCALMFYGRCSVFVSLAMPNYLMGLIPSYIYSWLFENIRAVDQIQSKTNIKKDNKKIFSLAKQIYNDSGFQLLQ